MTQPEVLCRPGSSLIWRVLRSASTSFQPSMMLTKDAGRVNRAKEQAHRTQGGLRSLVRCTGMPVCACVQMSMCVCACACACVHVCVCVCVLATVLVTLLLLQYYDKTPCPPRQLIEEIAYWGLIVPEVKYDCHGRDHGSRQADLEMKW